VASGIKAFVIGIDPATTGIFYSCDEGANVVLIAGSQRKEIRLVVANEGRLAFRIAFLL